MNRREMLTLAGAALLAPVKAIAAEVKPVRIKSIENFPIEIPASPTEVEAGVMNRMSVTRVTTESGVRGYSFGNGGGAGRGGAGAGRGGGGAGGGGGRAGAPPAVPGRVGTPGGTPVPSPVSFAQMRDILIGADLFAIEQHLQRGLIYQSGLEEAMWDTIGKVAGQPIHRLLGGSKTSVPVYITAVWPGPADQSQVPIKDQAVYARRLKDAGFTGFKMRIFRQNYMDDVDSCAGIIAACGPAPGFKVMVDRTAHQPGWVWDYPTGLAASKALQKVGVYWLEEPFARDDFDGPARLCREMDPFIITGGEGWKGLDPFREGLLKSTYDIFQPDLITCGGLFMLRKIAALCEAFHKPCIGHGSFGLSVAGRIQAHAAWGAPLEEFALARPPLLPQEQWAPALKILNQKELYTFKNGEVQVPQGPGLGLDFNEEAIDRFKV
ncbi:MAG TPA: enolase C-terminal domain-like protein [Bryobacteraceae bacterium]|jgi:L-alanine-DL-glutamate epimerase-like enolase superfamily enzyme|nr:enolase C-terminal domain-like protein [Bryobacteraceae bacterium]